MNITKNIFCVTFVILIALVPLACHKGLGSPSSPQVSTPTPTSIVTVTATATINSTPICGFTSVVLPTNPVSVSNVGPTLVRNITEWNAYYSNSGAIIFSLQFTPIPTTPPTPPINFVNQMLIMVAAPVCPTSSLSLVSVCEGPSQINVNFNNTQACYWCNMGSVVAGSVWAVAIPQSNLPVVWNYTQIPCTWSNTLTPTPTP